MVNLLIITSYLIVDPQNIRGGIGERYFGLYGSLIKHWQRDFSNSEIFWYSWRDSSLYKFEEKKVECVGIMSMPIAVFQALRRTHHSNLPSFIAILAYPYAVPTGIRMYEYIMTLIILRLLKMLGLAELLVDDFDPPMELEATFLGQLKLKSFLFWATLDILTLKGNFIIAVTKSFKVYLMKKHNIAQREIFVIPNGSLTDLINPNPPRVRGPLSVLYSGSLMPVKGISRLVQAIENIRAKRVHVNLILTGGKLMKLKSGSWVKYANPNNWLNWVEHFLQSSDICVIPYPGRIHWAYTSFAKTGDYMAAGKPIVSMNLTETSKLLRKYKCGLVARDWSEFESHILLLYRNRELAVTLGMNGRKAAENELNYQQLSKGLERILQSIIKRKLGR